MIRPQVMDRGMRVFGGGILICLIAIVGDLAPGGKTVACVIGSYGLLTGLFNFCPLCYFILQEKKENRKHEHLAHEISHHAVKALHFFEGFSDSEIITILTCCRMISVSPGQTVLAEGHDYKALYIIYSGQFKILKRVSGEELKLIGTIEDGETFGEFSFFRRSPAGVSVVCLEESKVLYIDETGVLALFEDSALAVKVLKKLMEACCRRVDLLHEQIASMGNVLLSNREAALMDESGFHR